MINGYIGAARNASHSFIYLKKSILFKPHFVSIRTFLNKLEFLKKKPDPNRENIELEPLRGIDDPNFSKHFIKALREPDFKKSYRNLSTELKKLYNEATEYYEKSTNFRIDSKKGRVDMLFTFETEEDIKNFDVTTDSSYLQGFSSASLKLTQEKTALFSGNICTDIPKDGNVKKAGYANFSNVTQIKSFYRTKFFDWTEITHLVFKIRGDGRTYVVLFNIHSGYKETQHMSYAHPLFTRGGPYWQIAKIPLSHFYLISKGNILRNQNVEKLMRQIRKLGITAVGFDGPFKLEIDYIGLEIDDLHKDICPYETYHAS